MANLISRTLLGGRTIYEDTKPAAQPGTSNPIDFVWEANGAIPVGSVVIQEASTADSTGQLVVVGAATGDHRVVGIYLGEGGTGADFTTNTLFDDLIDVDTPKAAVDGDNIVVRAWGKCVGIVNAVTEANAVSGAHLILTGSAGKLEESAGASTVHPSSFQLLDTATTTGDEYLPVWVNCL